MRIAQPLLALACILSVLAFAGASQAAPPWTLEELFTQPWPTGNGARHVALSDDGAYLACAWDSESESIYDLWVYDLAAAEWRQYTDLWVQREAWLRREFARELEQARQDWEEEHAEAEADEEDADAADETAVADEIDADEFDEAKRVEEFEKDLKKKWDKFYGVSQILFLRGGHELAYIFEGRVYTLDLDEPDAAPRERLNHEQGFYLLDRIHDNDAIALTSDSDIFLWWPADGRLRQLTTGGYSDYNNAAWSGFTDDLRYLAALRVDYTAVRKQQIPELLEEDAHTTSHYHVRPQDTPETMQLLIYDLSDAEVWPIEVELPEEPYYQVPAMAWSPLGDHSLLISTIDSTGRVFKAYLIEPVEDAEPGEDEYTLELLYEEKDEYWINWARTSIAWDNAGGLLLQSEYEGTAGLYRLAEVEAAGANELTVPIDGDSDAEVEEDEEQATHAPVKLYAGFEVSNMLPLRHSPHVLLELLDPDPSYRAIGVFNLETAVLDTTVSGGGMARWSALSEDEQMLAYAVKTETRGDDLQLFRLDGSLPPECILERNSELWLAWAATWRQQFMTVPGDAGEIPVKLWLPPDWREGRQYPLLIWLHGAGYAQAVARDAGFYTLFHPWVAEEHGWIVAEVDYRGSEGYGRDWRVDVWGRLGHPEVDDIIEVKHHLVDNFGADPERTALWGWSYGGFLTLMALGLKPGEFPVGCAVAPVNRWENYFYWYSTCRLGHPDENPDEYDQSAAETYLENVEDDLLILHGLRDDNTLFQSIAQYIEKGHELGVDVELKLFPSDDHGIGNEHHYVRIFEAIIDYCEKNWD